MFSYGINSPKVNWSIIFRQNYYDLKKKYKNLKPSFEKVDQSEIASLKVVVIPALPIIKIKENDDL
jgi:hypothetical protein